MKEHNVLNPTQFGFRSEHSTETALIKATDELKNNLDDGRNAALILLDLSAAFDTVDHSTLCLRLETMGIKGAALDLFRSFLINWENTVMLDKFRSKTFSLPCGVPKGSSLSPSLFNLYVAELAPPIQSFGLLLTSYADDTQIVVSAANKANNTSAPLYSCMKEICTWMSRYCLKLNSEKTIYILRK